ncbi:MAG: DUF378 domain-containing protein [Patescibacteria group bacterium]
MHKIAWVLLIIGGLNWGLVGINPSWNVVHLILGNWMWLERVVYILVGVAAIAMLFVCKCCMTCMSKDKKMMGSNGSSMDKKM